MKIGKILLSFGAGLFIGLFTAVLYHELIEIKQEQFWTPCNRKSQSMRAKVDISPQRKAQQQRTATAQQQTATAQQRTATAQQRKAHQEAKYLPTVNNDVDPDRNKISDCCAETAQMNASGNDLFRQVRILCWIMTSPTNLYTKAVHVNATWARHCNKVIFISSKDDPDFPAVGVDVPEGRKFLYHKVKKGFSYAWEHYKDDADWFLKADDDTYVIVENLRFLLKHYNSSRALYFGRRFKSLDEHGFMSGGAGYVLSRAGLQKYVIALQSLHCLQDFGGAEDFAIGHCMGLIGVKAMDTRDSDGKETFFPFSPEAHLTTWGISFGSWFWDNIYYPSSIGMNSCSDFAISFHYVTPAMMYQMEYFIYHLKAVGVPKLNKLDPKDDKITEKHKELARNIR